MENLETERKAERKKQLIPAVQVSYPQQEIHNHQRNTVSPARDRKEGSFHVEKKKMIKKEEKIKLFAILF